MVSTKHQFHNYLKTKGIKFTTSAWGTQISTINITYNDEDQTITLRDCRKPHIWFTTHYYTPPTIYKKYCEFVTMLSNFKAGGGFLNVGFQLN